MLEWMSPAWAQLRTAFGTAEQVPILLDHLSVQFELEVFRELAELLMHQYTIYGATLAAVPHLLQLANTLDAHPTAQVDIYIQCGMIEAMFAGSGAWMTEVIGDVTPMQWQRIIADYRLGLEQASTLHDKVLAYAQQHIESEYELDYILAAYCAYHGHDRLARLLIHYPGGDEYVGVCPQCDGEWFIDDLDGDVMRLHGTDPVLYPGNAGITITPIALGLTDTYGFHDLQQAAHRIEADSLLARLSYLNGNVLCPHCHNSVSVIGGLFKEVG
ncbi:hypothetical protein [Paenibacillus sp. WLX2291]|uniref:hypothetical protein n=1 Tax=Paenibacillus sp. WLX2291 TaxID=3296934 RepID=UPI0039844371